ncbi:DUF4212 domain-containing protein [Ideonella sp. TBM-1]|uniref:DUF4212 domain-containing protein n=2 Tax=Ideonella livida TaxID=2707176 RepID=A0A7C9PFT9_9BURK|nr:DUF4212 domain-containing protein [Ideonella livida]
MSGAARCFAVQGRRVTNPAVKGAQAAVPAGEGATPAPADGAPQRRYWRLNRWGVGVMLMLWATVSFLLPYHARALDFNFFGWPFGFWAAAQGALLAYLLLVVLYERLLDRLDRQFGRGQGTTMSNAAAGPHGVCRGAAGHGPSVEQALDGEGGR